MVLGQHKYTINKIPLISNQSDIHHILFSGTYTEMTTETDYCIASDGENVPDIGTRVKRGPDWDKDSQDNDGTGTVVGQLLSKLIFISKMSIIFYKITLIVLTLFMIICDEGKVFLWQVEKSPVVESNINQQLILKLQFKRLEILCLNEI